MSIIDVAGGHQPIPNEDQTIWAALNGEIFNYRELRAELLAAGHHLTTASDTEVIAHLYEMEGPEFVRRLRGMFAFAIWDSRRQTLLIARDRFGIKPLYFVERGGLLAFASEIKSLLIAVPDIRQLNLEALDDYVTLGYVSGSHTIFSSVSQLPPAHLLQWRGGRIDLHRYWSLPYERSSDGDMATATRQLRALLEDSVQAWTVSDVPVGVFLSGGLDSSAVTALMCRATTSHVKTFSIGFNDPTFNELPYAQQVVSRYQTDHHELTVDSDQVAHLPGLLWHLDEPFADESIIPTFLVSRLARPHVKVVLSGDGGDELFGGYPWTYRDQIRRWYQATPAPLRRTLERVVLDGNLAPYAQGWLGRFRRGLGDAASSMEDGYVRRVAVSKQFRSTLYRPEVSASLGFYDGVDQVRRLLREASVKDIRERMLQADQLVYLPGDILTKVDRMSMANSLEARTPLLDHRLAEFVAGLPFEWKIRGFTSKYLLKQAVRDLVPRPLLRQRKQGFAMPLRRWFRGDLGRIASSLLLGPAAQRRALWDHAFVRWMLDEHKSGRHDFARRLWNLLVFEVWARMYLDGHPPSAAPEYTMKDLI